MTEEKRERQSRAIRLFGERAVEDLGTCRVAVFGLGGVGGHATEALARSGIGALDICDGDAVALSNMNRQLFATVDAVGRRKTDVAKERLLSVAPDCVIKTYDFYFSEATADAFDFTAYDYVLDAVDDVRAKLLLIERAKKAGVPLLSAMGAGNKVDPTAFRVADLEQTSGCPLARVMRRECKKRALTGVTVVYSTELPTADKESEDRVVGSCAFVPSACGLVAAGKIVRDLIEIKRGKEENDRH